MFKYSPILVFPVGDFIVSDQETFGMVFERSVATALSRRFRVVQTKRIDRLYKADVVLRGFVEPTESRVSFPVAVQITTVPRYWTKRISTQQALGRKRWPNSIYIEIDKSHITNEDAKAVAEIITQIYSGPELPRTFTLLVYRSPNDYEILGLLGEIKKYYKWFPPTDIVFSGRIVFVDRFRLLVSTSIEGPDGRPGVITFLSPRKMCSPALNQALDQILLASGENRVRIAQKQAPAVNFRALPGNSEKFKRATDICLTETTPAPTLKTCGTTIIRRRRPIDAD
jgi:hypothetical protein